MAVIGIDSHKDTLAGCLIDADERVVEHRDVPNSAHGHAELVTWAQTAGVERVGIEGSGSRGRATTAGPRRRPSSRRAQPWWRCPRR